MAAGKGERLHPLTQDIPKALIYVAGRTLLQWSVKRLSDAGCTEIFIGIGWKGELVKKALKDHSEGISTDTITVPDYEKGPLQTFCDTSTRVHGSPIILFPVDLIISLQDVKSIIDVHPRHEANAVTLAVDYSLDTGSNVVIINDSHIVGINKEIPPIEYRKPNLEYRNAKSAMLLTFSAGFKNHCKHYLRRGESKISNVLNDMVMDVLMANGSYPIHAYPVKGEWFDLDTISDIIKANRFLLENLTSENPRGIYIPPNDTMEFGDGINLESNISIGPGVELKGPCLIQDNSRIEANCIIGPHVSIDENSHVGANTSLQDAVVFGSSSVPEDLRLSSVVIFQSNIIQEDK
ncbi:MAG: NDP-sugar synthase [Candidatus Thorarchaeota archaeon]|nr:MAG: NDP-sugar synthase [Candidatus Thorarchaeota archaeon]